MTTVFVTSNTVRNAVAAARRELGLALDGSRVKLASDGGDGLWRVTLETEDVVEVTIARRCGTTTIHGVVR